MTVGKLKYILKEFDDNDEVRIEACFEKDEKLKKIKKDKVILMRIESLIFDVYLREKDNTVIISNI